MTSLSREDLVADESGVYEREGSEMKFKIPATWDCHYCGKPHIVALLGKPLETDNQITKRKIKEFMKTTAKTKEYTCLDEFEDWLDKGGEPTYCACGNVITAPEQDVCEDCQ